MGFDGIPAKVELTASATRLIKEPNSGCSLPYIFKDQRSNFSPRSATAIHLERDTYLYLVFGAHWRSHLCERTANFLGLPEDDPLRFGIDVGGAWDSHIRDTIRSWKIPTYSNKALEELSRLYNPIIRGWLQYYGRFYRTALRSIVRQLDRALVLWTKRKYKKLRTHTRRARRWIASISRRCPELFAHWELARSVAP